MREGSRASTYGILIAGLIVWLTIDLIGDLVGRQFISNWREWIMMFIGMKQFISSILFLKYEKEG